MTDIQLLAVLAAIIRAGSIANPSDFRWDASDSVNAAYEIMKAAREKLKQLSEKETKR